MPSPEQVVAVAQPGESVVGWKLDRGQREELLHRLPPKYPKIVADHVTLKARVAPSTPLPDPPVAAMIVGRGDDRKGVEAMVVRLDGSTERAGGGIYHITWSLGPGRKAVESNDVLGGGGWEAFAEPISVSLNPAQFR